LVTAVEAAAECGVTVATVKRWQRAGHLTPAPITRRSTQGSPTTLYDWGQLLEVKTRMSKPRVSN
jgi:hypothetical protein